MSGALAARPQQPIELVGMKETAVPSLMIAILKLVLVRAVGLEFLLPGSWQAMDLRHYRAGVTLLRCVRIPTFNTGKLVKE